MKNLTILTREIEIELLQLKLFDIVKKNFTSCNCHEKIAISNQELIHLSN